MCTFFKCCEDFLKLQTIVQTVFAIPCSNSYVERVFSVMGRLWTQERNHIEAKIVKAELLIYHNIMISCSEFHNIIKERGQLLKAIRCITKYDFKKN